MPKPTRRHVTALKQHHQGRRAGDYPTGDPQGQEGAEGDRRTRLAVAMPMRLVDFRTLVVCWYSGIRMSMGMDTCRRLRVRMGVRGPMGMGMRLHVSRGAPHQQPPAQAGDGQAGEDTQPRVETSGTT